MARRPSSARGSRRKATRKRVKKYGVKKIGRAVDKITGLRRGLQGLNQKQMPPLAHRSLRAAIRDLKFVEGVFVPLCRRVVHVPDPGERR